MNLTLASLSNNNLMLLSIILLLVIPLASISAWYLTIKFKKNKSEIKFVNTPVLATMLTLQITSIITAILSLLFYLGFIIEIPANEELALTMMIVFIVLSVVLSAAWFSMVIFFSNQIWFYIDKEEGKLVTLGENIKLSKITKIIEDESKSAVYINYLEGKRTLKKLKFSKTTTIGMYFLENASATGFKVENGNEINYFKEEVAKIRATALNVSKPEDKKQEAKKEKQENEDK
ncbi:hypothetical protein [Spiroplasma monobiae]|uniref:Uncharacterized protein n=1 Tax=Spiroplasma monobiae MQ-1 TaxID=1336748 RepID=A0A2K9LTX7_SPISQ|nr:hypothetical protein [Spiroplasma monobiae]AUM62470.1 hypothetical protein SMONO_v1c02190 [Spiroplasma monobiae MQ-1]